MLQKLQNNALTIERVAIAISFVSFIFFLTSTPPNYLYTRAENIIIMRRLLGVVAISVVALIIALLLANRRLNQKELLPENTKNLDDILNSFLPIKNPILQGVFKFFPWIVISIVLMGNIRKYFNYPPMLDFLLTLSFTRYLGIATVAVSVLLFRSSTKRIPKTLISLWNRGIVTGQSVLGNRDTLPHVNYDTKEAIIEQYKSYINLLSRLLNDPRQAFLGTAFGLLGTSWFLSGLSYWLIIIPKAEHPQSSFGVIQDVFTDFVMGYILGLQVWRMIVIGFMIRRFGQSFNLSLQRGHPDGCEGLAPLGNICLWNALILSPAGIYLSIRLISYDSYHELIYFLLAVIIAIASLSFFTPIWNIHKIMVEKKEVVRRQLDQLGQDIHRLSWELLNRGNEMDPAESEKTAKKLERLHQIHKDNQTIPTWPFNTKTLARFVTSQIVPILSLVGLGQPIIELVNNIIGFLINLGGN